METKICTRCKETKPHNEFYSNKSQADGRSIWCRSCTITWYHEERKAVLTEQRRNRPARVQAARGTFAENGQKRCSRCAVDKDVSAFGRCKSEPDGLNRECKACRRERWNQNRDKYIAHHREWSARTENADSGRRWRKQIRAEMLVAYGSRCTCCGEVEPEFLTLDHVGGMTDENHPWSTKQRGTTIYGKLKKLGWPQDRYRLLCMNCNWAIRFTQVCPHRRVTDASAGRSSD